MLHVGNWHFYFHVLKSRNNYANWWVKNSSGIKAKHTLVMSLVQVACVQLSPFSFVALGKRTTTKKTGQHPAP